MAEECAAVAIAYLKGDEEANHVASRIRAAGSKALAVRTDLRDPEQIRYLFNRVGEEIGPVDILVNNAGIVRFAPFLEHSLESWTEVMDTNLRAAFLCSQIAAKGMAARGFGRIIH